MTSSLIYQEDEPEMGVKHQWLDIESIYAMKTKRGTHIQMVERPKWGISCYMDNVIQSCEVDEKIYHESLVHPAMTSSFLKKRVMIMGGGEGATLREVLKWPDIEQVDMYEWDKEVVDLFKSKYPQWAKDAWNDPRLTLHYDDIFEVIQKYPSKPYDVIIIDLFDVSSEEKESWNTLFQHLSHWVQPCGPIVIYAGMRNILCKQQPYQFLVELIKQSPLHSADKTQMFYENLIFTREVIPYKVYIPSFLGECVFLLLKSRAHTIGFESMKTVSHITRDVWKSYRTFNW